MIGTSARLVGGSLRLLLLCGPLISCQPLQSGAPTAYIGRNLAITLPSPREFGQTIRVLQLVTARHQNENYVFESRLSISPERLDLIGIDLLGRRALSLSAGDTGIEATRAPWLPDFIRAENVVADIIIIYWPAEILQKHLRDSHAELKVEKQRRAISVAGRDVIQVEYDASPDASLPRLVRYRNFDLGYELQLRSVAVAE